MTPLSKIEFEIIEGIFHDGLGTFAELALAIKLIEFAGLDRKQLALSDIEGKIRNAESKMQKGWSWRFWKKTRTMSMDASSTQY